jgi:hypothetical protein
MIVCCNQDANRIIGCRLSVSTEDSDMATNTHRWRPAWSGRDLVSDGRS